MVIPLSFFTYFFVGRTIARKDGKLEDLIGMTGLALLWVCVVAWKFGMIINFRQRESGSGNGSNENAIPFEIRSAIAVATAAGVNIAVALCACEDVIDLFKKRRKIAPEQATLPVAAHPIAPEV
ncbi:hypothetical protein COLO4_13272 [Corchorus olitorius]|uniref:Uncharacterized protein n=1 Tax=Corchorus olitorius TaxID=93759 RepID=A0A1R3JXA2_9ROSI|nr:hypothetical protein COLO4_13272 [Corchorus olitorius]